MNITNHQTNVAPMSNCPNHEHSGKKWYVMRVFSGKECKVKEYIDAMLKTSADLAEYVLQVLVPTVEVNISNRRTKQKPIISGYVFVEAELTNRILSMLRNVPNVFGFLGDSKGNPKSLSHKEVIQLFGALDNTKSVVDNVTMTFEIGDSVKVADGPFKDFNARIEHIDKNNNRLRVSVKIFGRSTPLVLDYTQVLKQ